MKTGKIKKIFTHVLFLTQEKNQKNMAEKLWLKASLAPLKENNSPD